MSLNRGHHKAECDHHGDDTRDNVQPCRTHEIMGCRDAVNDCRAEEKRDRTEPEPALGKRRKAVPAHEPPEPQNEEHERAPTCPCEMGLPPVIQHPCKIPPDNRRKRGGQEQHIGDLLRLRDGEKYEYEDPPHLKECEQLRLLAKAVAKRIFHRLDEQPCPREKAEDHDGQVEPPMCTHGMERRGEAADVVEADELVDERHAVHLVHIEIPRQTDDNNEQQPPQDVHAEELFQLTCRKQIEKDNPCRENHTNGAFCHHRKPARKVHQPVLPMDEGEERRCHEKKQRRVRHGCLSHIHEDDARPHDHPRPKACPRTEEPRRR